tara:strand:+ start:507 stop:734 length:228 start_codon:yes stop_codon:yes gene_type:complete
MSNVDLVERLRSRAKFLSGLDWKLMRDAADALERTDGMTPESVMAYFVQKEIKLLPWQSKRLLGKPVEDVEGVPI